MNQLDKINLMLIFEESNFDIFRDELVKHSSDNKIHLEELFENHSWKNIVLKFRIDETLSKYSIDFLNKTGSIRVKDDHIYAEHSNIWARKVGHLYSNHIELELSVITFYELRKDLHFKSTSFNNWIAHLGKILDAKIIYIIEDFENYHLKWFEGQAKNITLSNIDCFDNWIDATEAVKLMIENTEA